MKVKNLVNYIIAAAGTTGLAKAPALALRKRLLKNYLTSPSPSRAAFAHAANPRISFIIPVFNGAHHTLECLLSILRVADCSCEVIVVDDGSNDETQALLSRFENIRIHCNVQNLGFLRSINVGAKLARGEYLVLVNNDARLVEGSLAAALEVYESEKIVG